MRLIEEEVAWSRPASRGGRVSELASALPETTVEGDQHLKLAVAGKTFGYFLDDHHGDGIVSVCCKAAPGEQEASIAADPDRYYRPAYLGARGWIAYRLDRSDVDWQQVQELLQESYRLVAPKRLGRLVD